MIGLRSPARNRLKLPDRAFHDWYRFVLAFPPELVRDFIERADAHDAVLVDPFCGTGTALVEAKKLGMRAVGIDPHPVAALASRVKTTWRAPNDAMRLALWPAEAPPLSDDEARLLPRGAVSPRPLAKLLRLRAGIAPEQEHLRLALAATAVHDASNLRFGPEVYTGPRREDAPVLEAFERRVRAMVADMAAAGRAGPRVAVIEDDARDPAVLRRAIPRRGRVVVFTSPPYPNEKDYTRTTRLELVLLGFVRSRADLRALKERMLRSNTRNVFAKDRDGELAGRFPRIAKVAREIEERRVALGKTSGFERLYARVVLEYFGGMCRHLAALAEILPPGSDLGYVVGDQESYLRVPIRTGRLLGEVAEAAGFEVVEIYPWRERMATASRTHLPEEVVWLRTRRRYSPRRTSSILAVRTGTMPPSRSSSR